MQQAARQGNRGGRELRQRAKNPDWGIGIYESKMGWKLIIGRRELALVAEVCSAQVQKESLAWCVSRRSTVSN
jgi:hypothetical protein